MQEKICAVTGHRNIKRGKLCCIEVELQNRILKAIKEGYSIFMSGYAEGTDLLFASIVAELKNDYPIKLFAAIPYRNRLSTKDSEFQRLIKCADIVEICSESYFPGCFHKRNHFMVDHSDRLIAVYDGRTTGGTFATIKYAEQVKIELEYIQI